MKRFSLLFAIYITLHSCTAQNNSNSKTLVNHNISLSRIIDSLRLQNSTLSIYIDKSDFLFSIKSGTKIIKQYPIVLGTNPVGDKQMQGDRKTPEGHFKVRTKYPHKNWSKFIWIDYPTKQSYIRFNERKKSGIIPESAKIGGEIGIHGTPEGKDYLINQSINWTWGCISLTNKDVNEIYRFIFDGMNIEIVK